MMTNQDDNPTPPGHEPGQPVLGWSSPQSGPAFRDDGPSFQVSGGTTPDNQQFFVDYGNAQSAPPEEPFAPSGYGSGELGATPPEPTFDPPGYQGIGPPPGPPFYDHADSVGATPPEPTFDPPGYQGIGPPPGPPFYDRADSVGAAPPGPSFALHDSTSGDADSEYRPSWLLEPGFEPSGDVGRPDTPPPGPWPSSAPVPPEPIPGPADDLRESWLHKRLRKRRDRH